MNKYYSQYGQDKFLNEALFGNKRNGVFVDIGANDGITISNSYFFEKNLAWKGICFEPLAEAFQKLKQNRNSININGCATNKNYSDTFFSITGYGEMLSGLKSKYDERHLDRINETIAEYGGTVTETIVKCYNVNDVLSSNDFKNIDFISIDTEGGELAILKAIDCHRFRVKAIVIENNYSEPDILNFMQGAGFYRVAYLSTDEVYIHPKYYGYFKTFVIKTRLKLAAYSRKFRGVKNN